MGDVQPSVPTASMALIGGFVGFEISAVKVVRREQEPFIAVGMGRAICSIAMLFRVWYLPISNQFGFEFELAVLKGVFGGVDQIDDAGPNRGAEHFNRCGDQMNRFLGIANVRKIHHFWEGLSVVDV